MPKKQKLTTVKKRLWGLVSKFVRMDASDVNGFCKCVTCHTVKHYKEMQAGHFIPQAQGNAVKWDLRNIHPQCYRCNINLGGNGAEYYPYMVDQYGIDTVDELRRLSHTTVKFTVNDLLEMENDFKLKLENIQDKID